jgi:hypothetical protein
MAVYEGTATAETFNSVNPLAYAFAGSNPALPMVFAKRKVVTRELDENLFDYPRGALVLGGAKM